MPSYFVIEPRDITRFNATEPSQGAYDAALYSYGAPLYNRPDKWPQPCRLEFSAEALPTMAASAEEAAKKFARPNSTVTLIVFGLDTGGADLCRVFTVKSEEHTEYVQVAKVVQKVTVT